SVHNHHPILTSRLLSHLFFLSPNRAHPDLHSFPTRRSSDLAGPGESRIEIVAAVHVDRAGLDLAADALGCIHVARPDRGGQAVRDRKSTRLNSSHLGISYAVFCLKKKKK